jgi:hypothetical protein
MWGVTPDGESLNPVSQGEIEQFKGHAGPCIKKAFGFLQGL